METNFINNVGENTLKNKFLKYANLSDDIKILIGYFFLSGYNKIFSSGVFSKVKILVGLGTEKNIISAVGDELKTIEDVLLNVKSIENFINDLRDGKIEIRQTREENHSKTYIFNFKEGQANERKVILGSSNFSERGLEFRNEMNYEIDNKQDAEWANKHFDKLWDESIILDKDRLLESIKNEIDKSFINPKTPYQVFIKTLHCIFENEKDKFHTPNGYDDVEYQNVAVNRALTILKNYNGVILGDAVGLGKSIIASKICDAMGKARVLALCKPALILQWEKYLKDFYISGDVKSIGKIESISYKEYDVIVIDEAHNFRNDETKRYTELQKICEGKKIILLSATIFNNSLEDIENIIYLFQPRNSKIFGTEPLDSYFKELKRKAKKNEKQTSLFPSSDKFEKLRKDILEKVMIRRTKKEIREQYEEEKIKFPAMQKPINISYEFSDKVKRVFERTIEILKKELHYARYNALGYFNYSGKIKGTECNAASLIRTIFLKRLESSVHAFKETMKRVYDNYQTYCLLVNDNKKVPDDKEIVKEIDSVKDLNKFLEENATKFNDLSGYDDTFVEHLEKDIKLLEELDGLWKNIGEEDDNKIKKFIEKMRANEFSNRFIVFSESSDSVEFIYKSILSTKIYKEDEILCVTGAQIDNKMRKIIDNNFNPKAENPEDKIKVLVATDVLAEGVNLHKCNRLINYDITWNPVRLMQRNGRINRVGSKHEKTYIYNIYPTDNINQQIHSLDITKTKLNVFLSLIGNDEYTLSEEEILNSVSYIEKEEEKYSSKIDKEYNYFYSIYKKAIQDREFLRIIEVLPKNIKSCKQYKENGLITFYKRENTAIYGFIYNENEIDLYEGLKILECDKEEEQLTIPENNFYNLLERHKDKVKQNFNANMELSKNDKELIIYLKEKGLTEYVNKIRNKELICNSKTALDDLKNGKSIDEIFKVFTKENKKDIILNEYLMK